MPACITSLLRLLVSCPNVEYFSVTKTPEKFPDASSAIASQITPAPIIVISASICQK